MTNDSQRLLVILESIQFMIALKMVHATYKTTKPSNTNFTIRGIPSGFGSIVPSCWRDSDEEHNPRPGGSRGTPGLFGVKKCSFSFSSTGHTTIFGAFDEKKSVSLRQFHQQSW